MSLLKDYIAELNINCSFVKYCVNCSQTYKTERGFWGVFLACDIEQLNFI